jgi:hypothetical protein
VSGCTTKPVAGKSRFCYHLYYRRIIRTHRAHTARHSCVMMGLVAEVVVHLTLIHVSLRYPPLRQHKVSSSSDMRGRSLKASHLWGSVLKQTTSSPFAYRLTSERVRSTIIVGVPAFISFVLCLALPVYRLPLAYTVIYQRCLKSVQNWTCRPGFPDCTVLQSLDFRAIEKPLSARSPPAPHPPTYPCSASETRVVITKPTHTSQNTYSMRDLHNHL